MAIFPQNCVSIRLTVSEKTPCMDDDGRQRHDTLIKHELKTTKHHYQQQNKVWNGATTGSSFSGNEYYWRAGGSFSVYKIVPSKGNYAIIPGHRRQGENSVPLQLSRYSAELMCLRCSLLSDLELISG